MAQALQPPDGEKKRLEKQRPPPIFTDRRSLNRARPPPIYLTKEEGVTPGVYPKSIFREPRNERQKAAFPLATIMDRAAQSSSSSSRSGAARSMSGASSAASGTALRSATPSRSAHRSRRVVSEDHAPLRDTAKEPAAARIPAAINPLQNRLPSRGESSSLTTSIMSRTAGSAQYSLRGNSSASFDAGSGSGGGALAALRTSRTLTTQSHAPSRLGALNSRELATTGYAQLRARDGTGRATSAAAASVSRIKTGGSAAAARNRLPTLGGGGGGRGGAHGTLRMSTATTFDHSHKATSNMRTSRTPSLSSLVSAN